MRFSKKLIAIISGTTIVGTGSAATATVVSYNQTQRIDLSSLIVNKELGLIDESPKNKEKIIELIMQNNPNIEIDFDKLDIFSKLGSDNEIIVKPKDGDKTYKNQIELSFKVSQDLSFIILNKVLEQVNDSQKNREELIELIKEKNPNIDIDFDKLDLDIYDDKVIVKPKDGDKTYKNEVEIKFNVLYEVDRKNIEKIKSIWNKEFKNRFSKNINSDKNETKQKLLKLLLNRLEKHNIDVFVTLANSEKNNKIFQVMYNKWEIELQIGEIPSEGFHKYNPNKTELIEIGYYISENLTFKAEQVDPNVIVVPKVLPEIINDTSYMFTKNKNSLIYGIDNWDTSNVTNMSYMFAKSSFNQPLNNWNTSNVTIMEYMFLNAFDFNQDISNWNTSNVTSMGGMFEGATQFNKPLNNWNTSNVTDMFAMFSFAKSFNQPLNNWTTSNVIDMSYMFCRAISFNQNISNWDVSKVRYMQAMFWEATNFNQPIGNWNTSKVTNMSGMFTRATNFNQDISKWNVGQVISFNNFSFYSGIQEDWIPPKFR
ncbi:BspA family leucine-rich repeat surface protein [Mycoplasma yeatsii]|uniref:BspA family leucine-rich repeat surface protein n=1 Tax=Mycoplasma yeatsii TaxID=51365 RepID=UPI0005B249AD|nr:BspA family leucine-rich repeat surface protein [Mycoplasma yeatsii]AJM72179.1 PARCEL domain-containing protein [Mycoplasma yeatsii GM274B]